MDLLRIFLLGIVIAAADFDGDQFIFPDVPVKDFSTTGLRIEVPHSTLLNDRNRCGPILVADRDNRAIRVTRI